jgi:hypothetical protein
LTGYPRRIFLAQKKDAKAIALGRAKTAGDPVAESALAQLDLAGLDDADVKRIGATLREALAATNRFGSPDWDARLRAVQILREIRGIGTRGSDTGAGGRVQLVINLPSWAAPGGDAGAQAAPVVIDVTPKPDIAASAPQPSAVAGGRT